MILNWLLSQSGLVQALLVALHGILVFAMSAYLIHWLRAYNTDVALHTPHAPFFVAVSSVFALLLAFHVSSIWSRQHEAQRAFIQNQLAIQRFDQYTGDEILKLPAINAQFRQYVQLMVEQEWIVGKNHQPSHEVDKALMSIRSSVVALSGRLAAPVHAHLFKLVDDLSRSRGDILWIGGHQNDNKAWAVILVLGFLSSLSIAVVHLEKPKAGSIALLLFALATSVAYWSVLDAENPFKDNQALNPALLLEELR